MTRQVLHSTFTLEREFDVPPTAVFAAWSEPAAKARWFAGPDSAHSLDFRVGGIEVARGTGPGDVPLTFESRYLDILPAERIVYSSTLTAGPDLTTASVTTVEFRPAGGGTTLLLTEAGAFLDGHEPPGWREQGTAGQLDGLAAELRSPSGA